MKTILKLTLIALACTAFTVSAQTPHQKMNATKECAACCKQGEDCCDKCGHDKCGACCDKKPAKK